MKHFLLLAFTLTIGGVCATSSDAGEYTPWKYDAGNKRYHCYYEYDVNGTCERQRVIWYPGCDDSRYYYFIKPTTKQYWGRCVCPWAKDFNKQCMKWDEFSGGKWKPMGPCVCPPAPDDPGEVPIDDVPAPPKG